MPSTAAVRQRAEKRGLAPMARSPVGSGTAPSPSSSTAVQPRSSAAISPPTPRPTTVPCAPHPVRRRSQIPIDRPRARHQRATPARGFLPRGFSDACRPSARPRSLAAGIQEALTRQSFPYLGPRGPPHLSLPRRASPNKEDHHSPKTRPAGRKKVFYGTLRFHSKTAPLEEAGGTRPRTRKPIALYSYGSKISSRNIRSRRVEPPEDSRPERAP